jgi:AraC family transcriptional regulator
MNVILKTYNSKERDKGVLLSTEKVTDVIWDSENSRRSPEIETLLGRSSLRGRSSIELGWNGFVLERHTAEAVERPEACSDRNFIILFDAHPTYGEQAHPTQRWRFVPYFKRPGTLSLIPAGIIGASRRFVKTEMTVCELSPSFVSAIEEEMDPHPTGPLNERSGIEDANLRMLMSLLASELDAGGPHGRLYADSIAHAIATRFIHLGRATDQWKKTSQLSLSSRPLQRVLDRMNSEFAKDLSLETLAAESRYSRAHFLRMFRAATGQTPHEYLLTLRLENAKKMLKEGSTPLIDIAAACGFSSHTHFSKAFRARCGTTPSHYRRSL